jgi:hypothetical protein
MGALNLGVLQPAVRRRRHGWWILLFIVADIQTRGRLGLPNSARFRAWLG